MPGPRKLAVPLFFGQRSGDRGAETKRGESEASFLGGGSAGRAESLRRTGSGPFFFFFSLFRLFVNKWSTKKVECHVPVELLASATVCNSIVVRPSFFCLLNYFQMLIIVVRN